MGSIIKTFPTDDPAITNSCKKKDYGIPILGSFIGTPDFIQSSLDQNISSKIQMAEPLIKYTIYRDKL